MSIQINGRFMGHAVNLDIEILGATQTEAKDAGAAAGHFMTSFYETVLDNMPSTLGKVEAKLPLINKAAMKLKATIEKLLK